MKVIYECEKLLLCEKCPYSEFFGLYFPIFGLNTEAIVRRCSVKKVFLEISQNSRENTCARVTFLMKFIKKETTAQVFSCIFCKITKNTFFRRTPLVAVSVNLDQKNSEYGHFPCSVLSEAYSGFAFWRVGERLKGLKGS